MINSIEIRPNHIMQNSANIEYTYFTQFFYNPLTHERFSVDIYDQPKHIVIGITISHFDEKNISNKLKQYMPVLEALPGSVGKMVWHEIDIYNSIQVDNTVFFDNQISALCKSLIEYKTNKFFVKPVKAGNTVSTLNNLSNLSNAASNLSNTANNPINTASNLSNLSNTVSNLSNTASNLNNLSNLSNTFMAHNRTSGQFNLPETRQVEIAPNQYNNQLSTTDYNNLYMQVAHIIVNSDNHPALTMSTNTSARRLRNYIANLTGGTYSSNIIEQICQQLVNDSISITNKKLSSNFR